MDNKIRIELLEEDTALRVTPEFIHKFVHMDSEGYPVLDYGEGDEPIRLYGTMEAITEATIKLEQWKKDKRNQHA